MTGGLRNALGLPEINQAERVPGNEEFSQGFRAGLAGVNQDMQVVAIRGVSGDHQKLDANRQTLIKAYQATSGLGDASKNDQVMGAMAKVKQQTSAKATALNAGYEEWQKREAAFDAAVVKIGELEDANDPKAPAFRKVSEAIQSRVNDGDFRNANTAFDQLQPKLDDLATQPNESTPGMDGMDTGEVRSDTAKEVKETIVEGVKWATKQGETTIIIENYSSKVLSRKDGTDSLKHKDKARWVRTAPPTIEAAKDGKPGTDKMIIKTDMRLLGKMRGDTSGEVMYEFDVPTRDKSVPVLFRWGRKGDKAFYEVHSFVDHPLFDVRGHQSNDGEFTYKFTEKPQTPKPKDPQAPDDKKPKEPESSDTKPKEQPKAGGVKFEHTIGPFVTGKHDKLESGDILEQAHTIWNDERLAETKEAILKERPGGKLAIEVHGYTSNTDTKERNFKLSEQRAEAVIAALKRAGVPDAAFTKRQPHGEWQSSPTDDKKQEKENPDWRKVVVKVSQ